MKTKAIAIRLISFLLLVFLLCQAGAKATVFFKNSSKATTEAAKKVKKEASEIVTTATVEAVMPLGNINIDPFLYVVYKIDLLPHFIEEYFAAPAVTLLSGVKILYRSLICRNAP